MLNSKRLWTTTILLGIAFDILFWDKTPGISFAIFVTLILISGIRVLAEDGIRPNKRSLWLLLPIGFFATMTFIRAEPLTTFLNYSLTLVFLAFFAISFLGGRWLDYSLSDYVAGQFRLMGSALGGGLSFINKTRKEREHSEEYRQNGEEREAKKFVPIVRGLLIALPVVAIFAGLLSSADLVFAERMDAFVELFRLEKLPEYIFRGIYILILSYILVGVLLYAARNSQDEKLIGEEKPVLTPFLGFTEASIVLCSVLLLFAAFVAVQFQYFFGGQVNINIEGYTYAEYARRGFGELVTVAIFSLLLFLGLSSITRRADERKKKIFSALGITLVLLVLVMLASAFQRLTLYETVYGFSRLRTYPHIFMIWLGALLITVVALEIRQRQRAFAPAMAFAIIGFAATLSLLNVDSFIVRQNMARSAGGGELDFAYLASLSNDAIPALADAMDDPSVSNVTREAASASLICHWYQNEYRFKETRPWQSFHLSHWQASKIYTAINPLDGYTVSSDDWQRHVTSPSGIRFDCSDRFTWD
ncbi:MAG: DUF4173 domain-containing protein [Anaerolineae bacterium]|jgi:hypothetical protein|nr:DUF4173 domain-containing protein [Anaerolineae bacterium]MBT7071761.1 DUF4173 domain-containing protein [Anaerolineae bacterium]MBT7324481.1 DUF4173 domain-containing protein [Anaerolineae bacterium]